MSLPGDDLVVGPAQQSTRAIDIDAEPGSVAVDVQVGADRGGFYSYAWLENLFGLGIHNSDVVVPAWQHRTVGDLVLADAKGKGFDEGGASDGAGSGRGLLHIPASG